MLSNMVKHTTYKSIKNFKKMTNNKQSHLFASWKMLNIGFKKICGNEGAI